MRTIAKIFGFIFSLMIVIIVTAGVVFYHYINTDQLKTYASKTLSTATGRKVDITGDIKFSFFPWLGIRVDHITMSNAPGFATENFLKIKEADLKFKVLPLLKGQIDIGRINLIGFTLALAKDSKGKTNWQDMLNHLQHPATTMVASQSNTSSTPITHTNNRLSTVQIAGVDINDATISWDDQQKHQKIVINHLTFTGDNLSLAHAFPVKLQFNINANSPAISSVVMVQGLAQLDPNTTEYSLSNMSGNLKLKNITTADLPISFLGDLKINTLKQTLDLSHFILQALNAKATAEVHGTHFMSDAAWQVPVNIPAFNLRSFLSNLGYALPVMSNAQALQQASMKFNVNVTNHAVRIEDIIAAIDNTHINASFTLNDFATHQMSLNIKADNINIDHYLAVPTAAPASAAASASSQASNSNAPHVDKPLPIALFKNLNMNAIFHVDHLIFKQTPINNITVHTLAKNGVINIAPSQAQIYQGNYQGTLTINARNTTPTFNFNGSLSGVQVDNFLTFKKKIFGIEKVTGVLDSTLQLTSNGISVDNLLRNLNGTSNAHLKNGELVGVDFTKELQQVKALALGQNTTTDSTNQTPFLTVTAQANIHNGIADSNLNMVTPNLTGTATGTANLVTQQVDFNLTGQITADSVNNKFIKEITQIPLPFHLTGTFENYKIKADLNAVAKYLIHQKQQVVKEKVQQKVNNALQKIIDKKLGGSGNDNPQKKLLNALIDKVKF